MSLGFAAPEATCKFTYMQNLFSLALEYIHRIIKNIPTGGTMEQKCIKCGKPIPCCFFYCTKCEIEMFDKWEASKK